MNKGKELVIIGDSAFAEIAYEYFSVDSDFQVVGFTVEEAFISKTELFGLPIVPFERIEEYFDPKETHFFAALVYTQVNRLRTRLYLAAKTKGYRPASYISSKAFIWRNVEIGEHCFIFEDNTIQAFVKIGSNVILWSGNHIGHHSVIHDNCFIASQAVISGFCTVGENTFVGVNATVANNVDIGKDNWIGLGVTIARSTQDNQLFKGPRAELSNVDARRYFKVPE